MKPIILLTFLFLGNFIKAQNTELAITSSTENLTKTSKMFGINKIELIEKIKNVYYFSLSCDAVKINKLNIDFNSKRFSVEELSDEIILNYENKIFVKKIIRSGEILLKFGAKEFVPIEDLYNSKNLSESDNLLYLYIVNLVNEVTDKVADRSSEQNYRQKHGTWYVINAAWSSSVATSETNAETATFLANNPNCSLVGGNDTSCAWGSHVCISTQYFNCK